MPKQISEQLAELSTRAKKAEEGFATTKAGGQELVRKREDEIRAAAARRQDQMRREYTKEQQNMATKWSALSLQVQSDVDEIRAKIDVKKEEHDRNKVNRTAEQAEDNAMLAIDFAYSAVDYAETAALDAVIAREKAAALKV